jgi:translocation and assembly module TamA
MYVRTVALLFWWLLAGLWGFAAQAQTPALSPGVPNQPGLASSPLPSTAEAPRRGLPAARHPRVLRFALQAADQPVLRHYKYPSTVNDSLSALREVRALILALQADAYLTASADELRWGRDTVRVKLYVGDKFRWARLRNGNLGDGLLTRAGYRERFFRNQPFLPADWARLQERVLTEAENQGFPFATVALDSVQLRGADISGRVVLRRGRAVMFDSIQLVGNTKTKKRFLTKYLQIFPNQPFSQQRVAAAAQLLRQLPYLKLRAEPEVRFAHGQARVYFLLDDRPANQFDAIVGVLPNTGTGTTGAANSKVQFTGDVTINLRNIKGGGKQLGLQWRKTDAKSQLLDAQYVHPNFFGTPLELGATFNLYKQTDDFLTLRPRVEVTYPTARAGRLTFFTEQRSSRLLADSATYRRLTVLPQNIDSHYASYGLGYSRNSLDDLYFPRQGTFFSGQGAIGTKTIRRNADLNDTLYQRLPLRSTQISFGARVEHYFKAGRSGVLLLRLRGEGLFNARLFQNDLFRLGGLNSLRGFNENQYYASSYSIGTAEFRQFTGQDSYVFAFADQAYFRNETVLNAPLADQPTGIGAGISFRTGAGVFQFVYSVGRAYQQRFDVSKGKIHFGITSRF